MVSTRKDNARKQTATEHFRKGTRGNAKNVKTQSLFPGAKAWPGRDADHSSPSSAEVENE
jgi:hypothetical protein